jgi:hypothetical protein
MVLTYVTLAALLWQTAIASSTDTAVVRRNEIYLQAGSGERLLTHDGIPKRLPTISPSGDALIYVVDHPVPADAPEETVVVLGLDGQVRRRIVPEGYVPATFWRLDWLDEERIGAMSCGHANCMYWIMDPRSGKTIQVMQGGFDFIWSHNRQLVVRLSAVNGDAWENDNGSAEHDAVLFNRDDLFLYPPEKAGRNSDDSHTHDIGVGNGSRFVWSPDDKWVAFTDLIGPEDDWYVVILSPSGKMLRDTLPIGPDYKATLQWLDDTHLEVRATQGNFHFALSGDQFSEVVAPRDR